jgi:hypothetical protein
MKKFVTIKISSTEEAINLMKRDHIPEAVARELAGHLVPAVIEESGPFPRAFTESGWSLSPKVFIIEHDNSLN